MGCVYLRTNTVNGKQYVGQTVDFKKRENEWNCNKAVYAGSYINRARKKYGIENWTVEIIRECDTQEEPVDTSFRPLKLHISIMGFEPSANVFPSFR